MKVFRFYVEWYEDINDESKSYEYTGFVFAENYSQAVSKICDLVSEDVVEIKLYEYEGYSSGILLDCDIEHIGDAYTY